MEDNQVNINNHKIARPFFEEVIAKHVVGINLKKLKLSLP
ncbi:MAG: hypothetical protein ACI9UJ_001548 [bacterium]|jgi:hypothetical protein